jgi:hypothetical protein
MWMPLDSPAPQEFEDTMPNVREGRFGNYMSMKICPTSNNGVKFSDQDIGCQTSMSVDY